MTQAVFFFFNILGMNQYKYDAAKDQFWRYHKKNKAVYDLFETVALNMIKSGETRLSAKYIIEKIRRSKRTDARGEYYKINNTYAPFYARLFEAYQPAHTGYFKIKRYAWEASVTK